MKCRECGGSLRVMDTRGSKRILRRRKCMECGHMIFTLEQEIDYSEGLDRYSAYMHVLNSRRKKKNE